MPDGAVGGDRATTPVSAARDSYIPFDLRTVVRMCLDSTIWDPAAKGAFRRFTRVLAAFAAHEIREQCQALKTAFAPIDPDSDCVRDEAASHHSGPGADPHRISRLFRSLAERADFREVSRQELLAALATVSAVDVRTHIDFDDFSEVAVFRRGLTHCTIKTRRWFFLTRPREVPVYQRVLLMIAFEPAEYFVGKAAAKHPSRRKRARQPLVVDAPDGRSFAPGGMYFFLYKDVPVNDIELLFPNVETRMTRKDLILFSIPAFGASIPVALKALPQVILLAGVTLYLIFGPEAARHVGVAKDQALQAMPLITSLLALVIAFGGLAFRQYNNFKNKKIRFLKVITDTLFFKSVAANEAVFDTIAASAEDEESKEMILVYHWLVARPDQRLTIPQVDAEIRRWMRDTHGVQIDLHTTDAIHHLNRISTMLPGRDAPLALVSVDDNGICRAAPVGDAIHILEACWDALFTPREQPGH